MKTIQIPDVMLFRITGAEFKKQDWSGLREGAKKAFSEALRTSSFGNGRKRVKTEDCYVFCYADEESEISAMCVVNDNKAAIFFEEN